MTTEQENLLTTDDPEAAAFLADLRHVLAPKAAWTAPSTLRPAQSPRPITQPTTGTPKLGAQRMNARTNTPDRVHVNDEGRKVTRVTLKRACNGCGQHLGDADSRDVDNHGNLTDVRAECDHCRPLVELEAAGCKTWELTPRSFNRVEAEIDRIRPWVFTKGYWKEVDGKLQVVGLRIGEYPGHVVAFFGDWIVRHPDGGYTVHKAPARQEATT